MIRRLGMEDRAAFRALRQAALESHPESYATSGEDWRNAPDEKIDALLRGSVDGTLPMFGYFAPDLVGMVGLRPEPEPETRHKTFIWGLFVAPEWRQQKIGCQLMAAAIAEAEATPHHSVMLLVVTTDNLPALHLFESCGFHIYGTEPRARKANGTYYDQAYLCRLLQESQDPVAPPLAHSIPAA